MSSYSDNDDLNDRDLIGMIKNCMLQDKVNDQQITDILTEQIVYLRNCTSRTEATKITLCTHSICFIVFNFHRKSLLFCFIGKT